MQLELHNWQFTSRMTLTLICHAKLSDLKEIYDLEQGAYNEKEAYLYSFLEKLFFMQSVTFLVKRKEGKVIAFLIYNKEEKGVHILDIVVAEQDRRKNIGYEMLGEMIKRFEVNNIFFYAEVRASNISSVKCFKKAGFNFMCMVKDYYDSPKERAVILYRSSREE